MKVPEGLEPLMDYGIIQEVVRPLMSGKEAQVYVVRAGGQECVAKVYKEAHQRTFKHRVEYTEGRRTRNTRDQRAMAKRTQHGRKKDEDAWRSTEVDMIYRLRDAGVRVPEPMNFVEGVLVMELVKDADGNAAPRLGDLSFSPDEAREIFEKLIREVVRMLCAGVVHGDLSEFNVLMGADGPVVIDLPQAIDPTHNTNARKILLRDVENLHRFLARSAPDERRRPYAEEIWALYQANRLKPDSPLSGVHEAPQGKVDTAEVMSLIDSAQRDEMRRRGGRSPSNEDDDDEADFPVRSIVKAVAPLRKVVDFTADAGRRPAGRRGNRETRGREATGRGTSPNPPARTGHPVPPTGPAADRPAAPGAATSPGGAAPERRRRRRRRGGGGPSGERANRGRSGRPGHERDATAGSESGAVHRPAESAANTRPRGGASGSGTKGGTRSGPGSASGKSEGQGAGKRRSRSGRSSGTPRSGPRSPAQTSESGNERPARRRRPRKANQPE